MYRFGDVHPHFYMGPLAEAIKEAGGSSAKEVRKQPHGAVVVVV